MKIHEYQAKELFKKYGVPVLPGRLALTKEEARKISEDLGGKVIVKAQIHAGGRGKAGGVKLASNPGEAESIAGKIIGMNLISVQTGPQGKIVKKALVESACDVKKEYYLALALDRAKESVAVIASAEGGVEIEEVAKKSPEKILKFWVSPSNGFNLKEGEKAGERLGFSKDQARDFSKIVNGLYKIFTELDCSLVEINPLVVTADGRLVALDGKINFDDSGIFRHPEVSDFRDIDEENPADVEAARHGLSYIALDGNIGCLVNGAGLAMATMDIIKHYGGEPANFLDVGGAATKEAVAEAFKLILKDSKVKAVLVNIFGGIVKCDLIAQGIVDAAREMKITVPLVVRLQGTNVEMGREILKVSGLNIISAEGMAEAARKVVEAVTRGSWLVIPAKAGIHR